MRARFRRHQEVQPHDVVRRIVQHQIDVIEGDDSRQSFREILKQLAQVSMLGNRFGNRQECPVLLA